MILPRETTDFGRPDLGGKHKKSISNVVSAEVEGLPEETDESQAMLQLEITRLQRDKLHTENQGLREGVKDQRGSRSSNVTLILPSDSFCGSRSFALPFWSLKGRQGVHSSWTPEL